ncbi:MAG: DUF3786 domain-containing protein [Desulfobacteraceae bacterium]|nr:DUF3786 domain-containing protein [Desulfobacteraceae bacterium]
MGYNQIYKDLLARLKTADLPASARNLGLALNDAGEVIVQTLGAVFLASNDGVRRSDGRRFSDNLGSVIIHYLLNASGSRPAGKFVTFAELAGPLFKASSYSGSALELPIIKCFAGRVSELLQTAADLGGRRGGEAGLGALSLIFEPLPHIFLQLIFYDRDEEFPARATLLFDVNATQFVEFEVLAVLVTEFVRSLTRR